tara:strand:+ start:5493 stop:5747 length:255 start_codon:yes stop_codon:yes gene_type:complete
LLHTSNADTWGGTAESLPTDSIELYLCNKGYTMRRGTKPNPIDYIKVRIDLLREEKKKNEDNTAHLVLDKAIYELSVVLDLLIR